MIKEKDITVLKGIIGMCNKVADDARFVMNPHKQELYTKLHEIKAIVNEIIKLLELHY